MAFLAAIKKRTDLRAKGVAREADDRDPTTITDTPWVGELDPKRFAELPSGGKWMLFYSHNKILPHWKKCQQLYRNNKLKGVSNMKVSTSHHHHSSSVGVIILYCGPPDDEKKVKVIGQNILIETGYTNPSRKMLYKTDTQTLAKGKQGWSKYSLPIPQSNFEKLKLAPRPKKIDDHKQEQKTDMDSPLQYTRAYLQSLSKSRVIDIVMKLQKNLERKSAAPMPPPVPPPIPRKPVAPLAPMAPMAPIRNQAPLPSAPMAPVRNQAPLPGLAPLPGANVSIPVAPPIHNNYNSAPVPGMPAPAPLPGIPVNPVAPPIDKKKRKYSIYDKYLKVIKNLGFERTVMIKRDNFDMLASSNKVLDSKKKWSDRMKQQSVLNGRQRLVVLNWFRKEILMRENIFNFQSNWSFPPYILNIITLHYLENIDDKEQLQSDWHDNYKPCFYFYQKKWNILLREGDEGVKDGYQSLVCLKGKECLIAKQCKTIWIICSVRIMAKKQMQHRYQWMSYKFKSAPEAYNILCRNVFDDLEEESV